MRIASFRPSIFVLCSTLILPAILASPWIGAEAQSALVNCYDEARGLVMRTTPGECQGRQVSDAQAAAIQERRRAYVRESIESRMGPSVLGKRLVSVGAGFFVTLDGRLLTNAHVIKDCATLTVSQPETGMQPARLIAAEPRLDLALLATAMTPPRTAVFAPPMAPLPTEVAVVGFPNQGLPPIAPLITFGQIEPPPAEAAPGPRPVAIKADIRPGHSGGPILDRSGRVIGVVFAAVDTPGVYARTGRVVRDIGVAIPHNLALDFLARHGVTAATRDNDGQDQEPRNLLDEAQAYVARIECWF